jgi:hypothetical protein
MIGSLVMLVVYLIVIGLVIWLLTYLIDAIPLPEPFNRVARVAILVIGVLIVIVLLLQFAGMMDGGMPRLGR